jgi:NAD(P)-dependent dehydrogenase (short-subunit alcohol dehydrogenase family)
MADLVLTGASRGIGHALALALAGRGAERLVLVARDRERLDALVAAVEQKGGHAVAVRADLSSLEESEAAGRRLAELVGEGATLVHNAGLWPDKRVSVKDGLEEAFVVNHLAPLVLQRSLLDAGRLARIMVVSAGLIAAGRFDAERTPRGDDFSVFRTYCTSKLAFAIAMRDVAAHHPELDVVVLHPGVVRTDLGGRPGLLGRLLSVTKLFLESPEACAERLARILARPRWSPAGDARWFFEEKERPWPVAAEDPRARRAVREATARLLAARAG